MDVSLSTILKVKEKLDSGTLKEDKILKYLQGLDEININVEILKSTGIGKSVNNLKRQGGSIALLSKALVKKWKSLLTTDGCDNLQKTSLLNSSDNLTKKNVSESHSVEKIGSNSVEKRLHEKSSRTEKKTYSQQKVASMQLCDLSFVSEELSPSPKKKQKTRNAQLVTMSPSLSLQTSTLPSAQEIGQSLLPDIQPNYVPQKQPTYVDNSPQKRKALSTDIPLDLLSSRKSKTQVFSGRRNANRCGVVTSLHEMCIKVLVDNIEALFDTGGVPYDILEPVLAKCTPAQLWNLEEYNPYFLEDTGPLWKTHCQRDFKETWGMKQDDWRTFYLKKHEEREDKLKSIDAKIKASQAAKQQGRQMKLAYVHVEAKAPPQVRRKQAKHGTSVIRPVSSSSSRISSTSAIVVSPKKRKQTTSLMKKVKQMGNMQRSRVNSSIIRR